MISFKPQSTKTLTNFAYQGVQLPLVADKPNLKMSCNTPSVQVKPYLTGQYRFMN